MTELKPLTHDERKAADAAFRGRPADSDWTDAARLLYVKRSIAIAQRAAVTVLPWAYAPFVSVDR